MLSKRRNILPSYTGSSSTRTPLLRQHLEAPPLLTFISGVVLTHHDMVSVWVRQYVVAREGPWRMASVPV